MLFILYHLYNFSSIPNRLFPWKMRITSFLDGGAKGYIFSLRESEVPIGNRRFRLAQDTKPSEGVTPSPELQIGCSIYIFWPSQREGRNGEVHFTFRQLHKMNKFGCQHRCPSLNVSHLARSHCPQMQSGGSRCHNGGWLSQGRCFNGEWDPREGCRHQGGCGGHPIAACELLGNSLYITLLLGQKKRLSSISKKKDSFLWPFTCGCILGPFENWPHWIEGFVVGKKNTQDAHSYSTLCMLTSL